MDLAELLERAEAETLPPLKAEVGIVDDEPTADQLVAYIERLESALVGTAAAVMINQQERPR